MMDYRIFDVASASMNREHLRIRHAAEHIANANSAQSTDFVMEEPGRELTETSKTAADGVASANTVEDFITIMTASRLYEANVTVISAARAAFEKALEISGRR